MLTFLNRAVSSPCPLLVPSSLPQPVNGDVSNLSSKHSVLCTLIQTCGFKSHLCADAQLLSPAWASPLSRRFTQPTVISHHCWDFNTHLKLTVSDREPAHARSSLPHRRASPAFWLLRPNALELSWSPFSLSPYTNSVRKSYWLQLQNKYKM